MVPVRDAGYDYLLEIVQHVGQRLRFLGRIRRQLASNRTRFDLRQNRITFRMGEVVRNPVNELISPLAKFFGAHVGRRFQVSHLSVCSTSSTEMSSSV